MPVFESKTLFADTDGLNLLAAVLHPTEQSRAQAVRRGQTLVKGGVGGKTANTGRRFSGRDCIPGTPAA